MVVSKTFTTAETMLNARTMREWISSALGLDHPKNGLFNKVRCLVLVLLRIYLHILFIYCSPQAVAKHMVAVSTNLVVTFMLKYLVVLYSSIFHDAYFLLYLI